MRQPPRTDFFGLVTDLQWHEDGRGRLMEILRHEPVPDGNGGMVQLDFGQAYVTTIRRGVVKAWHHHQAQTDRIVCLHGALQIGLWDEASGQSATVYSSPHRPRLVTIRPGIWHGFACLQGDEAVVLNLPDRVYRDADPDEQRRPAHDPAIPYRWGVQDG